ncbi:restriction endonuclease [Oculatella sp. LEGE 06141]|uniref:Eco57I restriction-modification methylase domain-containing protein n=1 Tax=Oculatella sp. LEGE 06141 TaxID=1828648 RepID=UPI00188052B1|nr:DNA methyltransferase [Oculatella sp. LEGE 06141]MBE9179396.1 restriction endonuclease [Oculatella sp. LEGE 06141]
MSTARHHAEWLSLVEVSGPFLSLPVLLQVFPNGLEAHEPEQMRLLRLAHEEWEDNQKSLQPETAIHRAWVEFVLQETLGLPGEVLLSGQAIPTGLQVTIAEHQETLRPDWVVVNPRDAAEVGKPRLLVQVVPAGQDLEKGLKGSRWAASPATRMMELLHACNVRLGLLTNGEHWMLVNAPKGETTGYISWYATLWQEEPITFRAFRSLLGVDRFFRVDEPQTLEVMLAQSINSQQEVTDQLGYQVRKAVDVLVQSIDRIDQDRNRSLLQGISETRLYEAALTVMMRLVFLFSAEERKLIPPHENELYNTHYAVSTLRSRLREQADQFGEEVLERRQDAWCRLLATFRAVYAGVDHDALFIPAYGGSLFDPDRFPFLEGRREGTDWKLQTADPIPVNNRTVLHLLEALQILQVKVPGGGGVEPRKLSFRALDIEQIGHVYEGLLDHTAVRAADPILGLVGTKDKEPEISLAVLEAQAAKGESALVTFLKEQTGKSPSALQKAVATQASQSSGTGETPQDHQARQRLLIACNNDRALLDRILPFAKLIRFDTLDYPVVIPAGSVYVTAGVDRRQTGTHYTPRNLTEEIVQYTLEPLVYEGVAEGKPKEAWRLRSPAELLQLKICDMAMGSGAFLVQTCRYLAEKLVEAWQQIEAEHPGQVVIAPEGTLSAALPEECPIPKDADERLVVARRIVADRCLYGVDKNPLAVEMAKLSLWLITLAKGRPFTFLNHALKCGDSLLGVGNVEQLEKFHLNPQEGTQFPIAPLEQIQNLLKRAIDERKTLEQFRSDSIDQIQEKERRHKKAESLLEQVRFVGDLLVGEALKDARKATNLSKDDLDSLSADVTNALSEKDGDGRSHKIQVLQKKATRMLTDRQPFHWVIEFPEVFLDESAPKGFSAIVGNPPFQGGQKITGALGTDYRNFLVEYLANSQRGSADLCAYFFLRANQLTNNAGGFGLVATNTIAQGDTREVGLDQLVANGCVIHRAVPSIPWIGSASLEVAYIWINKCSWRGNFLLRETPVLGITTLLTALGKSSGNPIALQTNANKCFIGSTVVGLGFVLDPKEAKQLICTNPTNKDVLFPYLVGEDLNSHPEQLPSRWIINFSDWALDPQHDDPKNPKGSPYAADYPDCLAIVKEKVKPDRERLEKGDATSRDRAKRWWQFARPTIKLYRAIAEMDHVLAIAIVSKTVAFTFIPTRQIYAHKLAILAFKNYSHFCALQSNFHYQWAWNYSSTMKADLNYSPSDCFETFPFPTPDPSDLSSQFPTLDTIGETYYTHRQAIMRDRQEGLTKTYNRFHDANETASDIQKLRELHVEMDQAVAAAYGWQDLDLGHGFHQTKQGDRFTISETARREVLDRLLELNHQRYAEEVAQGLHDKKKGRGKSKSKEKKQVKEIKGGDTPIQTSLF